MLAELELTEQQHNRGSGQLSGGQRKRTSTALELLTKPSLLFLDEPTSGLDPDLDSEVMTKLRDLADDGRTVVVVTHSTLNLHVCDLLLVLAEGGHLAYLGKPEDALTYFEARSYSEMFHTLKRRSPLEWAQRFRIAAGLPAVRDGRPCRAVATFAGPTFRRCASSRSAASSPRCAGATSR